MLSHTARIVQNVMELHSTNAVKMNDYKEFNVF